MGSQPGRREIGHGKACLARHPSDAAFRRAVPLHAARGFEITESNGSSSIATVCAAPRWLLMDAGVPLQKPVAGIAMGLIREGERWVLSDAFS